MDFTLITAFSRANPQQGKTYVQNKIRENGEFLSQLILKQEAFVYVSGRAQNMPKYVWKAFSEAIHNRLGAEAGSTAAEDYMNKMKKDRRYQIEVW